MKPKSARQLKPNLVKGHQRNQRPYLGLYEVFANGQIIYTDSFLVIVVGALIDGQTMQDHTAERMQKLIAIHSSPNCRSNTPSSRCLATGNGFCRNFRIPTAVITEIGKRYRQAQQRDNLHLLCRFSPDSLEKIQSDLVRADKCKAWNEWMLRKQGAADCGSGCDTTAVKKTVGARSPPEHYRHTDHFLCQRRTGPRCRSRGDDHRQKLGQATEK